MFHHMIYSLGSNFELHCTLKASRYCSQVHPGTCAVQTLCFGSGLASAANSCCDTCVHSWVPALQRPRMASPVRPQPLEMKHWQTPEGQLHIDPFTLESYVRVFGTQGALNLIKREASVWLNLNRLLNHNKSKIYALPRLCQIPEKTRNLRTSITWGKNKNKED